jgi:hypothetical protein
MGIEVLRHMTARSSGVSGPGLGYTTASAFSLTPLNRVRADTLPLANSLLCISQARAMLSRS